MGILGIGLKTGLPMNRAVRVPKPATPAEIFFRRAPSACRNQSTCPMKSDASRTSTLANNQSYQ